MQTLLTILIATLATSLSCNEGTGTIPGIITTIQSLNASSTHFNTLCQALEFCTDSTGTSIDCSPQASLKTMYFAGINIDLTPAVSLERQCETGKALIMALADIPITSTMIFECCMSDNCNTPAFIQGFEGKNVSLPLTTTIVASATITPTTISTGKESSSGSVCKDATMLACLVILASLI